MGPSESEGNTYKSSHSLIARLNKSSLFWIAIVGILHISYSNAVVQIAIAHLGASVSCVLNYTMPIFVAILSYIVLKEKFSYVKSMGIGLAFIGLFIIMNFRLEGELSMMFLALSGALSWAVANLIIKTKLGGLDKLAHTTLQLGFGTFFLIIYSCIVVESLPIFNLTSILCLLYNGVLASALCYVLWSFVVDQMDPSALAVSSMLTPLIGVLGGVVFLSERLSSRMVFGMVLLLLGVLLVQIVVRHQKKSSNTVEKKLQ
jgi:drug/metabolite transporter (DMT)-like permease